MNDKKRSCGSCHACCVTHAIDEVPTCAGDACKHCSVAGCAVYSERPDPCRSFRCLWLDGFGPEDLKPSIVGFVISGYIFHHEGVEYQVISLHGLIPGNVMGENGLTTRDACLKGGRIVHVFPAQGEVSERKMIHFPRWIPSTLYSDLESVMLFNPSSAHGDIY